MDGKTVNTANQNLVDELEICEADNHKLFLKTALSTFRNKLWDLIMNSISDIWYTFDNPIIQFAGSSKTVARITTTVANAAIIVSVADFAEKIMITKIDESVNGLVSILLFSSSSGINLSAQKKLKHSERRRNKKDDQTMKIGFKSPDNFASSLNRSLRGRVMFKQMIGKWVEKK